MSGHGLAFPDLESAAIKEQYPDPDDTRLLKRFQANWIKYNEFWDTNTKKDLLKFIKDGAVKTSDANRYPSGHKFWKVELTWATWIVMRTHYGIKKLRKLQAKLAVKFPRIVVSSWVCPATQYEGFMMADGESDDGPLYIKPEEHSGKNRQGSLATSEIGEAGNLEAQTYPNSDSRKRTHPGTPEETQRVKRRASVPSKTHAPTHHSLATGPLPTPQRRSILDRMEDISKGVVDTSKNMPSMISHPTARLTFPTNDTHIGTPLPMSNGSLLQRREQGGRVGPQDMSARAFELARPADREAKIREVVDKIEECVNELIAPIPEEMNDLKRSVNDLRSATENHCKEIQEAKETIGKLQRRVNEQQNQIDSQGQVIGQMEDAILSVWQKLDQLQEQAPQHSQAAATPRYMATALRLNRTLPNAAEQYSVTNSMGGRALMNAGPGTAQPNNPSRRDSYFAGRFRSYQDFDGGKRHSSSTTATQE